MIRLMENMKELDEIEILQTNGGETPGKNTSFANDVAYYVVFGLRVFSDGLKAFSMGAARGQEVRFSG